MTISNHTVRPALRRALFAALLAAATAAGSAAAQVSPSQVSPETRARMQAIAQACRADGQRLCNGVQPGGGRILACLNQQIERVSIPCRDALADLPQQARPMSLSAAGTR
ncbi:hypothetical protein HL658_17430 [Azospirillum sp. RWY-5-1]|uniref:Cysteine rich repeat-containing protein n=1 Tax=Azospirillum oleiclasticum TaxID=2735135 RepID=A0ABX2TGX4_9PROT|nr:cysteine rich repeat-containing protein [Azospirillum oleiclasticum]NYZ14341.1 hypothetical protein [Azospirillum oleiclasticum]NYZ23307.1 hypothetical protein [Azospirillum oleiclasticum]